MKSFYQLAKSAYHAWHKSHPNAAAVRPVAFEQLPALNRARWIEVAKVIKEELESIH